MSPAKAGIRVMGTTVAACMALASPLVPSTSTAEGSSNAGAEELLPDLPLNRVPRVDRLPSRDYGSRKMRRGDVGTDVQRLQRLLTKLGLRTKATGRFGERTERNVKRDERRQQRRVNGVVSRREARDIRQRVRPGGHRFPVRGPYSFGGPGSRFGAPRPGRTHKGQDVAAAQGTPLLAVHDGRVAHKQYQAGGAGHYVVIHGADGSDSVYMHLVEPPVVRVGERVHAGQRIGNVGTTGSSTGPHLHFELWTRHWYAGGHPYDPLPKLRRWAK